MFTSCFLEVQNLNLCLFTAPSIHYSPQGVCISLLHGRLDVKARPGIGPGQNTKLLCHSGNKKCRWHDLVYRSRLEVCLRIKFFKVRYTSPRGKESGLSLKSRSILLGSPAGCKAVCSHSICLWHFFPVLVPLGPFLARRHKWC